MEEKINIFYFLKCMTYEKKDLDFSDDVINKNYDIYMINRYVSMVDCYLPFVNELNKYTMSKESHFNTLKDLLPNQKVYFKYIKKKKDLTLKEKKYIANYFEIGLKEAELYVNNMTEENVKSILKLYKYGKNKSIDV